MRGSVTPCELTTPTCLFTFFQNMAKSLLLSGEMLTSSPPPPQQTDSKIINILKPYRQHGAKNIMLSLSSL